MARPIVARTRSPPATSTRGSGASRCSRSSSPPARSSRGPSPGRRGRDAGVREPALRARGAGAAARGRSRGGGRRAADRAPTTGRAAPAARRRRRARAAARRSPARECMDWAGGRTGPGYAAQGNILVSARDGGRAGGDVRGDARAAARRAAARVPRRGAGRGRRPARAAGGRAARRRARRRLRRALRRRRRPARGRPRAPDRGAAAHLRHPHAAVRQDARRGVARRSTASSPPRCASRLARLGYASRRAHDWAGVENLEERIGDDPARIDPVVLEALREASA